MRRLELEARAEGAGAGPVRRVAGIRVARVIILLWSPKTQRYEALFR